jgi:hypothetical protein
MIKKSVHEDELIAGMQHELRAYDEKQGVNSLVKAAEYLHSAMEILEEAGLTARADQVLKILSKIAGEKIEEADQQEVKNKSKITTKVNDPHTKGLTPEKMVENLKHHGIVFNMADDKAKSDDLLEADIGEDPLEVEENSFHKTFEDSD